MKKVFLKIIKEDSIKKDPLQKKKDSLSKVLVAGDSIAVGMSINGMGLPGAKCCGSKWQNLVPTYPAVMGGQDSEWIKNQILTQLSEKEKDYSNHKLIIIAGTNDALNSIKYPGKWSASNAIENVNSIAARCKELGIDFTVMNLAPFEPKGKYAKMKNYASQMRKKDGSGELDPAMQTKHNQFIEEFNTAIAKYNNFDLGPTAADGIHVYGRPKNKSILNRALSSLKISISQVEIPTHNPSNNIVPKGSISSTDCHVNSNCNCVDRSISGEVTITSVQRALKLLGVKVDETGQCDTQTQKAIMNFQKSQQEKGFKPPDGREFLRCDGCVGTNTMAAINQELSSQKKTLQGMLTGDELIKVKKRRVRILKSMSGSGKTLEDVKKDAAEIGCHTDLVVLATVLHSEPTWYGRWSDEGYAVFNTIINRIQANGPGKGPHFWGPDTGYRAWNICLNTSPIMKGQSGANPPFSSKNYPRNLSASVEKVKDFVKKRLSEGSNVGSATFFVHTNAQQSFYDLTQLRIQEFGSKQKALEKAISEHAQAGIKWQGSIKTKWPKVKPYPNPRNKKKTTTRHPLMFRWRGFGYGKSAQQVRDSWTRGYGGAPEITVGGSSSSEIQKNKRKLKKSSIEVFGNREKRKNWSRKALSDEEINNYLTELLREKEQEFANV